MCFSAWMVVQFLITIVVVCVLVAVASRLSAWALAKLGGDFAIVISCVKVIIAGFIIIWIILQLYYLFVCMGPMRLR